MSFFKKPPRIFRYFIVASSVLAIAFVGFSYVNWTPKPILEYASECACRENSDDPFERPMRYVYGAFAGQCIDSCSFRAPKILKAYTPSASPRSMDVANVFHDNMFWTARIPMEHVKRVDILFETFARKTNHVALRFVFSGRHKVVLTPQSKIAGVSRRVQIFSLVVSPEAAPPLRKSYSLVDGFMGRYALMFRVYSYSQFTDTAEVLRHPLRLFRSKLDQPETEALLALSLIQAQTSVPATYQLLFNNCATTTIDLVLEAKEQLRSPGWDIWDVLDPLRGIPVDLSIGTIRSLQWWHLVEPNEEWIFRPPPQTPRSLQEYGS